MYCRVTQTGFNLAVSGGGSSVPMAEESLRQADLPQREQIVV